MQSTKCSIFIITLITVLPTSDLWVGLCHIRCLVVSFELARALANETDHLRLTISGLPWKSSG